MKALAKVGMILLVWVVIPCALGVAGYYYVGPNIGKEGWLGGVAKRISSNTSAAKTKPATEPAPTLIEEPEPRSNKFAEPQVEVSVSQPEPRRRSDSSSQRRKKKRVTPKRTETPTDGGDPASTPPMDPPSDGAPPVDEGGSGGAGSGSGDGL